MRARRWCSFHTHSAHLDVSISVISHWEKILQWDWKQGTEIAGQREKERTCHRVFAMFVQKAIVCEAISYHRIPLSTQTVSPELANWWLLSYERIGDFSTHNLHVLLHPGVLALQQCSGLRASILRERIELSSHRDAEKSHPPVPKQLLFEDYIRHKTAQTWKHDVHHIYFHRLLFFLIVVQNIIEFIKFSSWNKCNCSSVNSEMKHSHTLALEYLVFCSSLW